MPPAVKNYQSLQDLSLPFSLQNVLELSQNPRNRILGHGAVDTAWVWGQAWVPVLPLPLCHCEACVYPSPYISECSLQSLPTRRSLEQFSEGAYRRQQAEGSCSQCFSWGEAMHAPGDREPSGFSLCDFNSTSASCLWDESPLLSSCHLPFLFSHLRDLYFRAREHQRGREGKLCVRVLEASLSLLPGELLRLGVTVPYPHISCPRMTSLIKSLEGETRLATQ